MKLVIAPDKFKDSLTGFEFCDAVEAGVRAVLGSVEIIKRPLADGGDGTMEVIQHYLGGSLQRVVVNDPLFRPVEATYLYAEPTKTAYVEMARASGLHLLTEPERNCMNTTSLGTGELIADALEKGAQHLILGIGGSATNDGGVGMACGLGYQFFDQNHQEVKPTGANLSRIHRIDSSNVNSKLRHLEVKVACDVTNPLYGNDGAAHIYAAQKGASSVEIGQLDDGLRNYADVLTQHYGIDVQHLAGAGAAGGMGAGTMVFLNGQLTVGIELIKEVADFDQVIHGADWVVTGEGRLDGQTLSGKTIQGVLTSARHMGIPVAALCGSVGISFEEQRAMGLSYVREISEG